MTALTLGLLTASKATSVYPSGNDTCSILDIARSFITNGDLSRYQPLLTCLQSEYNPYPTYDFDLELKNVSSFEIENKPLLKEASKSKKSSKKSYGHDARCLPKSGARHPDDEYFYRYSADSSSTFVRRIQDESRCDVILYLRSKDIEFPKLAPGVGATLIKADRVRSRSIETVGDICKEINSVHKNGGRIKGVIIEAHGTPKSLTLNQNHRIIVDNVFDDPFQLERSQFGEWVERSFVESFDPLPKDSVFEKFRKKVSTTQNLKTTELTTKTVFPKKQCLHYLEPEAPIILLSCSAGGENSGRHNLADAIAHQAIGHPVFAPRNDVFLHDLKISNEEGKLKASFSVGEKDFSYKAHVRAKSRKTPNKKNPSSKSRNF